MTLSFKYKKVKRPNGSEIKSPSVPIVLGGNGTKYQFVALLDSGADVSLIPFEVAELLGLDLTKKKEEAEGIGGRVEVVETKMNVEIGKPHENYSFSVPVKVVLKNSNVREQLPVLLGRAGFFDRFAITFNQSEERVLLKYIVGKAERVE